ncbi:hypothetical protein FRB90_009101, partial [Tulasnella sp. 427]
SSCSSTFSRRTSETDSTVVGEEAARLKKGEARASWGCNNKQDADTELASEDEADGVVFIKSKKGRHLRSTFA